MDRIAVLASGNGSNFQALVERLQGKRHSVACLICDRKDAFAFQRAQSLGVPSHYVRYAGRTRQEAEHEIIAILRDYDVELVVLAGFMRLLTPLLVDAFENRIVNIHPSLLPKYPGTNAIEESFASNDRRLGITIHYVDYGMDSGPIIAQRSLPRIPGETLKEATARIHALEHETYPKVVLDILRKSETDNLTVHGADRRMP